MHALSVNVARAQPLSVPGPRQTQSVLSGIAKRSTRGPVEVQRLGLVGDEQADLSVHGGIAKAVYAYPREHYPFWQTVRAQAGVAPWGEALPPGFLGENLTLEGLLESQVFVGDVLCFPDCQLAVSEPRYPCFKFNAVMGFNQAGKLMAGSAWCGFYLTVLSTGSIEAGQAFELLPGPREVGIVELFRARVKRA